jgi:drug/metabolite transporter (DMT)-like permease
VSKKLIDWLIFIALSIIWGSSFILMKIGLDNKLSAYQVAAIRVVAAGLFLMPVAIRYLNQIPTNQLLTVFLSGILGSLLPAFLFCIAEEEIDSSLAGVLNSLTPIFVIIIGALFFKRITPTNKIVGIIIAFAGCVLLLLSKGHMGESRHFIYSSLVLLATVMYGFNVNLVSKYLVNIPSLQIAAVALSLNAIPGFIILMYTGFFSINFSSATAVSGTAAAVVLGVGGTAIATVLFYMLVKRASGIFASMVTYGIPFVAIAWGIYFKENFGWSQVLCMLIILFGVYWVNRTPDSE